MLGKQVARTGSFPVYLMQSIGANPLQPNIENNFMDNTSLLETLTKNFSRATLGAFLRAASGSFRPEKEDLNWHIEKAASISDLAKLGQIDFGDSQRLVVLAGQVKNGLTSQSGKQKQYELAKKVLKQHYYNAGIFVFHDEAGHFRFSLITAQYSGEGSRREFSSSRRYTYFVSPEQSARTFIEQIGKADFSSIEKILAAFSVEPVTKEFFKEYRKIFEEAEAAITLGWNEEKKRLYTQRFFNRMMFIAFLERKGWLRFDATSERKDYLAILYTDYRANEPDKRIANFHKSRLNTLFFQGLNNPQGDKLQRDPQYKIFQRLIGDVPYLNGGLFEEEPDDIDGPLFSDTVVAKILSDLVYKFNFTVTESTPLDIEVAVDPEMLGRIFEELVTGRHESGSYYTPKPVVAFMCREALKGYLGTALPAESDSALAQFVDKNDPGDLRNPELVLNALKAVKVCDPACGSGAYLLGMLHELLEQRECLFAAHVADAAKIYDRKLEIIQNNLYGVDLDPFAVNIARLRLWLSLIVDYEGDTPPPLPNLDFKIEPGDSLTAPDPSGGLQPDMFRQQQVKEFLRLKNDFMSIHAGSEKKKQLSVQIKQLRLEIEQWAHPKDYDKTSSAFDWQVDFAEVFAPELAESTLSGKMTTIVNNGGGQMELTSMPKPGGFDIVLVNPPYVRMELFKDIKPILKKIYANVHSERADLYVYFYARATQILKSGGVACFISSNKWLRSGYGEKLRQYLLDQQAFTLVVDFGDLPVFQSATAYPSIFVWKKIPRGDTSTSWTVVTNLQECYDEGITEYVARLAQILPATQFGKGQTRLVSTATTNLSQQMKLNAVPLGEYVSKKIYFGIKPGLNDAFIIDQKTRDQIINADPDSAEIIKSLVVGDDIRRYEVHIRHSYLLYMNHGIDIRNYPAIENHLKPFRERLEQRATKQDWYELQQPQNNFVPAFLQNKIIYPQIGNEARFVLDREKHFPLKTVYSIASDDWYLLGILNSASAMRFMQESLTKLRGGYFEFYTDKMQNLPIPDPLQAERETIAKLAEQAQNLHSQRRRRVEQFLREIGIDPAQSTSRNPLEVPWSLSAEEFTRRTGAGRKFELISTYEAAREETMAITERIVPVEKEIDERVKALYGI
jgi:type I restriction-modification system DNA methylase subunit